MLRRSPLSTPAAEEENPYWLSFSDMMAGLLAIFLLVLASLLIQFKKNIELQEHTTDQVERALRSLVEVEDLRQRILQDIQNQLRPQGIFVEIDGPMLVIPNRQIAFERGEATLSLEGERILRRIGEATASALQRHDGYAHLDTIFVEGHTDSRQMTDEDGMGNWRLSANRAVAVLHFWQEATETRELFQRKNAAGEPLLSVSGYADTRRARPEERTAADYEANRRINLRFQLRPVVSDDLRRVLQELQTSQQGPT
jgi:flagellar motor protein MotB